MSGYLLITEYVHMNTSLIRWHKFCYCYNLCISNGNEKMEEREIMLEEVLIYVCSFIWQALRKYFYKGL